MADRSENRTRAALPIFRLITAYLPIPAMRWLQSLQTYKITLPDGIRTERVTVGGVPCEWMTADTQPESPVILYLHGGGFVFGVSHLHRKMLAHLTGMTGGRALMVDYRLAPQHPYPAPVDDCIAVYTELLAQGFAPERIVIAGDSAGAYYTLSMLPVLRDRGLPLPAAAVCMSPPTDLRVHDEERWTASPDKVLHPRAVRFFREAYLKDSDPENPLLSPVLADLRGLPPLLLFASVEEGLYPDVVKFAEAAGIQGVDVTLTVRDGVWHAWPIFFPDLPQAVESVTQISDFVAEHTRRAVPVHP